MNDQDLYFYNGKVFTGIGFGYENEENQTELYEYSYFDGQLSGPAKGWDIDGNLFSYDNYEYNLKHGIQKKWFDNGNIAMKSIIEHGFLLEKTE